MVEVTQEHISWATSIAQHLCHPADRDAAIRLVSDGLARFEQEVLARASTAPDAEPVAYLYERDNGSILLERRQCSHDPYYKGWTETPLYAGKPCKNPSFLPDSAD